MPLPLISASPPSAFCRTMRQIGHCPSVVRPGSPRRRPHRSAGRTGRGTRSTGRGPLPSEVDQDQEVVAGTVVLGEPEEAPCRGGGVMAIHDSLSPVAARVRPGRAARHDRRHRVLRRGRSTRSGVPPEPRLLAPGEGPGPPDRLVDRLASGTPSSTWVEQLPVAEGLAGRPRQAAGTGGQRAGPRRAVPRPSCGRTARRSAGRRRRRPVRYAEQVEPASADSARAPARTTRTAGPIRA